MKRESSSSSCVIAILIFAVVAAFVYCSHSATAQVVCAGFDVDDKVNVLKCAPQTAKADLAKAICCEDVKAFESTFVCSDIQEAEQQFYFQEVDYFIDECKDILPDIEMCSTRREALNFVDLVLIYS